MIDWRERAIRAEWRTFVLFMLLRQAALHSYMTRAQAIGADNHIAAYSADAYWWLERETSQRMSNDAAKAQQ